MKKLIRFSLIIISSTMLGQFAFAQNATALPVTDGSAKNGCECRPHSEKGKHMDYLVKELGLTEQQKEQLKALFKAQHPALKAIHENGNITPEQKRDQMKSVIQGIKQQASSFLTAEQQRKWAAMKAHSKKPQNQ